MTRAAFSRRYWAVYVPLMFQAGMRIRSIARITGLPRRDVEQMIREQMKRRAW